MAFIQNPDGLPDVNHKDENPRNNCVYNLEWCTAKYNSNYGTMKERLSQTKIEKGLTRKVVQYTYDGEIINTFDSILAASKATGVNDIIIGRCCSGEIASALGLHFRYFGDKYDKRIIKVNKLLLKATKEGNVVAQSRNGRDFCRKIGISYDSLQNILKGRGKQMAKPFDGIIEIQDSYGNVKYIIDGKLKI